VAVGARVSDVLLLRCRFDPVATRFSEVNVRARASDVLLLECRFDCIVPFSSTTKATIDIV
jgi:hypothetical protein